MPLTVVYPYPTVTMVPATVDLGEKRGERKKTTREGGRKSLQ
jgi:hypothetical protein